MLVVENKLVSRKLKSRQIFVIGLSLFFAIFILSKTMAATAPTILNYQGKITENGVTVTTSLPMAFILYSSSTDGNILYTSAGTISNTSTINVTSTYGVFSVNIGGAGTNSLDPSIFQNYSNVYLEVWVNGERMVPRRQLMATPYSFNSKYLDGVAPSTNTNTTYIPVSDANGNFNFNHVTSTKLNVAGTSTLATTTITNLLSATGLVSMWTNDAGYINTSTGLTVNNFASPNISQWTNNSGYITASGARSVLSSSATGLTYGSITGDFSLTPGYTIPTTVSASNWNTAFGWGDHATEGYLTADSADTLTNKGGNISMWTNDRGYITSAEVLGDYLSLNNWYSTTTLPANIINSSLTSLGTVNTGVWHGTTIGTAYGGTGITGTPDNGQLLIGDGSGYVLANLAGVGGIDINNGLGSIDLGFNFDRLTEIPSAAGDDYFLIYDETDGTNRKISKDSLFNGVLGSLSYQGAWDADANDPAIVSSVGTVGYYYVVSVSGTTNIDGITSWNIGDWIVFGSDNVWEKIESTNNIASVFGRTGIIVAQSGDYDASQIDNVATGTITAATVQAAIDELANEKENSLVVGTTGQYYRGDKSWQTLDTSAVTENLAFLYYTNARVWNSLSSTVTGLTFNQATGDFSLTPGYVIPLTNSTTDWNEVYNTVNVSSTYWDLAYSWSDHALVGYLTTSTDLTVNNFISQNVGQWINDVGYLTSYTETDPIWIASSSDYLTIASASSTYAKLSLNNTFTGENSFTGTTTLATTTQTAFQLGNSTVSGYVLTADSNGFGTWREASGAGLSGGLANTLSYWTSGNSLSTTSLYWSNSNSRFGVGSSTPYYNLAVNGTLGILGTSTLGLINGGVWHGSVIGMSYGGTGTSTIGNAGTVIYSNGSSYAFTDNPNTGDVLQYTNGVPQWVTTSSLGIVSGGGTIDGTGVANQLAFWSDDNTLDSSSSLYWDNTNGRLGIGTNTPAYTLDVNGDINIKNSANVLRINGTHILSASGTNNILVGNNAGLLNTGSEVVIIGDNAGRGNSANFLTAVGSSSGYSNSGSHNSFFGFYSGFSNTSGLGNVFIGMSTGRLNNIGSHNTYLGLEAGLNATSSQGNIFLGYQAGSSEIGSNKLYIENSSSVTPLIYGEFDNNLIRINGQLNVTATSSLATTTISNLVATRGSLSGMSGLISMWTNDVEYVTSSSARLAISTDATGLTYDNSTGVFSLDGDYVIPLVNSTTDWNTAYSWGDHAIEGYLTSYTETDPIWIASSSDYLTIDNASSTYAKLSLNNTFSGENTFTGTTTLATTTASSLTVSELSSGSVIFAGDSGLLLSSSSLYWDNVNGRLGIGTNTPAYTLDVNGDINIKNNTNVLRINGSRILSASGTDNILIGKNAGFNNTGINSVLVGSGAGFNNTGDSLTAVGYGSGYNNSGASNSFLGIFSGYQNTSGVANVFIGAINGQSNTVGSYNTYLGYAAGNIATSSEGNIFLGYNSGYNETGSNKLYIENSNSATPLIYGEFDNDLIRINGQLSVTATSSFGVVASGTWQGTKISYLYGGTNTTTLGATGTFAFSNGTSYAFTTTTGLLWDSTNNRLGIGSSTPYYTLTVNGTSSLGVVAAGVWQGTKVGYLYGGTNTTTLGTTGTFAFSNGTSYAFTPSSSLFWDSTNNRLGIGSSTPYYTLTVNGTSSLGIIASGTWRGSVISYIYGGTNTSTIGATGTFAYSNGSQYAFTPSTSLFWDSTNNRLGIGSSSPQHTLSVSGTAMFTDHIDVTGVVNTSTIAGPVNVGDGALVYDYNNELVSIPNLELGALVFPDDAGMVSWVDLAVTASSTVGVTSSYSAQIDGNAMLTVYGVSDGNGGVSSTGVLINTTTISSYTFDIYGSLRATGATVFGSTLSVLATSTLATTTISGWLGIGTAAPQYSLDVNGTFRVVNTSTLATTTITALTANTASIGTITGDSIWQGTVIGTGYGGTGTSTLGTAGTFAYSNGSSYAFTAANSLYWDNTNGRLGIGTSTPSEKLTIMGGNVLHKASGDPTLEGSFNTTGTAYDVYVSGKYAYVADGNQGMRIIDVNNPATPVEVGSYDTGGNIQSVVIGGSYAYVSDMLKIHAIDISNPSSSTLFKSSVVFAANDVFISGKVVYALSPILNLLWGFDVSPELEFYEHMTEKIFPVAPNDFYVSGQYAYVADGDAGLYIADISDLNTTSTVGNCTVTGTANSVFVSGKYAYVAAGSAGLVVVDVSDPYSPTSTGLSYNTDDDAKDVFISGKYAYVADGDGLVVIDISDVNNLSLVGSYNTTGTAYSVFVSGKYAYVADGTEGLVIIDINGTETPSLYAGNILTNSFNIIDNVDVGNNLYVGNSVNIGNGGMLVDGKLTVGGATEFTQTLRVTGLLKVVAGDMEVSSGRMVIGNSLGSTTSTFKLYVDSGSSTTGAIYANGYIQASGYITGSSSLDLAETYPINPSCNDNNTCPEPGDAVCLVESSDVIQIEKCTAKYSNLALGVISTNPGLLLGGNVMYDEIQKENYRSVALSGRVPVKISLNNGDIKTGDLLTVSDETGLVMKAIEPGFVVGMAIEGSDRQSEDGEITMFVNPHWTVGSLELEKDPNDTSFADANNTWLEKFAGSIQYVLKKLGLFIKSGVATLQSVITDDITTKNIQTDTLCVGETCVSEDQLIELLQNSGTEPVSQQLPVDSNQTPAPTPEEPAPTPEEPAPTPEEPA
ncbi:MAG: hypothetical protein WA057_02900, partial [Candidatus Magasanikiibacteriota bacterium]